MFWSNSSVSSSRRSLVNQARRRLAAVIEPGHRAVEVVLQERADQAGELGVAFHRIVATAGWFDSRSVDITLRFEKSAGSRRWTSRSRSSDPPEPI